MFRVKDKSFKVKDDLRTLYLGEYPRECFSEENSPITTAVSFRLSLQSQ